MTRTWPEDVAPKLRGRIMPVKTYRIAWHSYGAHLRTRDAGLIAQLGRFLGIEPELEGAPPAAETDNLITVTEADGEFVITTRDWQSRAASREQLLFTTLEAVRQIFIHDYPGAVFHAGAFLRGNAAIAFFGAPQSGKSTLGFAAWQRDLALLGDDRIMLSDGGRCVRPFPKCVKLRLAGGGALPPGAEQIPIDMMVKADLGYEIRLILARALPGFCAYGTEAEIDVLVELRRGAEGETTLAPLAPEAARDAALHNVVSPEFDPMAIIRLIKRQAEKGKLYRLTVGPGATGRALDLLLAL